MDLPNGRVQKQGAIQIRCDCEVHSVLGLRCSFLSILSGLLWTSTGPRGGTTDMRRKRPLLLQAPVSATPPHSPEGRECPSPRSTCKAWGHVCSPAPVTAARWAEWAYGLHLGSLCLQGEGGVHCPSTAAILQRKLRAAGTEERGDWRLRQAWGTVSKRLIFRLIQYRLGQLSALCPRVVILFIPSQWRCLGDQSTGWVSDILSHGMRVLEIKEDCFPIWQLHSLIVCPWAPIQEERAGQVEVRTLLHLRRVPFGFCFSRGGVVQRHGQLLPVILKQKSQLWILLSRLGFF